MNTTLPAKPTYKSYDDEFRYTDEIESNLAQTMQSVEEGPRYEHTSSQAVEEYHRLHEGNVEARKQFRFGMQEEFKAEREGRILHMNQFLEMLKKCGIRAWYTAKGGMPKSLGLFVSHPSTGEPQYICFVQVPFMQEYEELYFDRFDVPLGPKRRGWRTVLLRLIQAKLLTESQAHAVFGAPATGVVSRRYRECLSQFRNLNI